MSQSASRAVRERPKNTRRLSFAEMQARIDALEAEVGAAREREVATAEIFGVINSSPSNLAPVFDAMLEKATRLCDAGFGILWTYDGHAFHAIALRNVPAPYAQFLTRAPYRPVPQSVHGRIIDGERLIHIADVADTELYRAGDPLRRALVDPGEARSGIAVSLRKDETLLGMFVIYRQEVRPFTDKQIALLENFAAQAVIAMENARLLTETREALEKQTATAEILRVISRSPTDVQPTFDAIATSAATLCGAASGAVFQFDGTLIHFVAHCGYKPDHLDAVRSVFPLPPGRGTITARAILTRAVVHVADMLADPEFAHPSIAQAGFGTTLSVPMLREGSPIGAITVTRHEIALFSDAHIELLKTFADQAVIAIENVRLFDELRERTNDLQQSLEYQTATSDVLKVISRSGADLEPVLDTLVEIASRICQADEAMIMRLQDGLYRMAASFGYTPEFVELMARNRLPPDSRTVTGQTALERRVIHIRDTAANPDYRPPPLQAGEHRTALGVPLLRDETVIGVIFLARARVEPFTEK